MNGYSKSLGIDASGRLLVTFSATDKVESKQISVGTTRVELKSDGTFNSRKKLFVRNTSTEVVYLGDQTVTADTLATGGFPLNQWDELELDATRQCAVYAIVAAGAATVAILEVQ